MLGSGLQMHAALAMAGVADPLALDGATGLRQ